MVGFTPNLVGKRVLMVLDDAADHTQVEPLLPGEPGCLVLVTSRRRLEELSNTPQPLALAPLPPRDADTLFLLLSGRTEAEHAEEAVAWITRACGGLPLAIALLAGPPGPSPGLVDRGSGRGLRPPLGRPSGYRGCRGSRVRHVLPGPD
ncbi:NB-ARC domain-containing protein [Peterkaempfera bronchialis]|uniref:NB-ARC domain-containing protein n=1 Tax=Peterkaempfera bronchialis TaxID=2126346 RepID=A0A345SSS4_9ACTN|nr:hypothetical protein C7M71_004230 [Peterkaempfera bronchialis]